MSLINPKGEQREVKLTLDAEAAELLLKLAGSPRKQGEYISNLIRQVAKQADPADLEISEESDAVSKTQVQRIRRELATRIKTLEEEVSQLKTRINQ